MSQYSVFASEGDDVGDGGEGGQTGSGDQELSEFGRYFLGLREILSQGPGEFEGDAGAAKVLVGIILARQIGMQDGKGRR